MVKEMYLACPVQPTMAGQGFRHEASIQLHFLLSSLNLPYRVTFGYSTVQRKPFVFLLGSYFLPFGKTCDLGLQR